MRVIERRIGILFAVFVVALTLTAVRATWLGSVRAEDMRGRALAQQRVELTVPARRGTIRDRRGVELAVSEDSATVFANPRLIDAPGDVAAKLAPLLDRPQEDLIRALGDRSTGFVYLRRQLDPSRDQVVENLKIEGIDTVVEPKRRYPQGPLASQLLGTVGIDNYGLAGIEQAHDRVLRGRDGRRRLVKDALGEPVSIVEVRRAEGGQDLELTIDVPIQERVEAVLGAIGQAYRPKGATALVLDPRNGEVLALANWPRVNANDVAAAPPYARQNRAIAASYEPGSTFKAFTVSGALAEGLISPETPFGLPPRLQVADRTIKEAHDRGFVTLTVRKILAQSSNVGSVLIGQKLGEERFDRWVRRFGFGSPTGIDLPGEASGIVPRRRDYSGSSIGNLPIGQGLAVTPVQLAAGYAAIANGGIMHRPHVVRKAGAARGKRVMPTKTAREVSRMLEGVFGVGGTASEASIEGYKLAGKTGTAQKPDGQGGYSKTDYVASFVGYAPARKPRLLVAVAVDSPRGAIYGGVVAAPAFEKIVSFALPYLRIPPK